jgi:hypothetical protein
MRAYGVPDVVEFKQSAFVSAYGALSRIAPAEAKPYVPVSRAALEQAYSVSPAAAALKPFLEGADIVGTLDAGCATYAIRPCDGEIRAAWFMWMLREGAARAGQHIDARTARRYYRQLAHEINAACAAGALTCGPPRATMVPPFRSVYIAGLQSALQRIAAYIVGLPDIVVPSDPRSCAIDDCKAAAPELAHYLSTLHETLFVFNGDTSSRLPPRAPNARPDRYMQHAKAIGDQLQAIVYVYRAHTPQLIALGALAFAAAALIVLWRRRMEAMLVVATLAAITCAARFALLAYLDATSIPSVNSLYLSPGYPFLLLFAALGPAALARVLIVRAPQSGPASSS